MTDGSSPRRLQPGRGTGGHGGLSGPRRARPGDRSQDMLARHEITGLRRYAGTTCNLAIIWPGPQLPFHLHG